MSDDPTSDEARAFEAWAIQTNQVFYTAADRDRCWVAFLAGRASATPKSGEAMELRAALTKARTETHSAGLRGTHNTDAAVWAAWAAVEAALVAAERERVPPPLFVTSGNHLSGYRVTLGYATLAEAQAAHEAIARRALTKEPNG